MAEHPARPYNKDMEPRPLIDRIFILPVYGTSKKFNDIEDALTFLKNTDFTESEEGEPFIRLEVKLRYTNGLFVDVEGSKDTVVDYLERIDKIYD